MKRYVKKLILLFVIVFIGIQFFPTNFNENTEVYSTDFILNFKPPKQVEKLIKISCYDCHSNNTYYPWYNKVQPIAWFLEGHINKAKEELNFSEFGDYSKRRQKSKLKSIISQIKDDEMPLASYTLLHQDAKLSKKDKKVLEKWLNNIRDTLKK